MQVSVVGLLFCTLLLQPELQLIEGLPGLEEGRASRTFLERASLLLGRRVLKEGRGASSKHLYCKLSGGCSQCQEDEEIERYCADTGFKEELRCTTSDKREGDWPVELIYPYPPDVHIAGEEGDGAASGTGDRQGQGQRHGAQAHHAAHGVVGPGKGFGANAAASGSGGAAGAGSGTSGSGGVPVIRVVRSCTEGTLAAHAAAGVADLVAAERASGGDIPSLLHFELGMLALLGLSLPVVYWRKIRIRHL